MVNAIKNVAFNDSDEWGFAQAFYAAVAYSLVNSAYEGYLLKSAGQADDTGATWKPVSTRTIAYSRKDWRSKQNLPNITKLRPTLTKKQNDIWKLIFVSNAHAVKGSNIELGKAAKKARDRAIEKLNGLKLDTKERHSRAAALAWQTVKSKYGATTLLQMARGAVVPIMVDDGNLLASVTPGDPGPPYTPPPNQHVDVSPGKLVIYSTAPNVEAFKFRSLWPPGYKLWIDRAVTAGKNALRDRFIELL